MDFDAAISRIVDIMDSAAQDEIDALAAEIATDGSEIHLLRAHERIYDAIAAAFASHPEDD